MRVGIHCLSTAPTADQQSDRFATLPIVYTNLPKKSIPNQKNNPSHNQKETYKDTKAMKLLKNIGKILLVLLAVFLCGYLVFCFRQA